MSGKLFNDPRIYLRNYLFLELYFQSVYLLVSLPPSLSLSFRFNIFSLRFNLSLFTSFSFNSYFS